MEFNFTDDFLGDQPPIIKYNYIGTLPTNLQTMTGTRLYRPSYNSTRYLALHDISMITLENHPLNLHGLNFFEVGKGVDDFNPKKDLKKLFN